MRAFVASLWSFVRAVSGDSAYETYERRQRSLGVRPLSRGDFYLDSLRRRYSRVSRCC